MFDLQSRYASLPTATRTTTDGSREVRYVRRRFLPPPASGVEVLAEHTVVAGDRLDNVTARYLGDPLQFWRLCDANRVLHPDELTDEVGERIRIALPRL
ncbi:MAG: LysM domain-containing protein [Bacteroidota bacterium]